MTAPSAPLTAEALAEMKAKLALAAPTDMAALIAEVERLQGALNDIQNQAGLGATAKHLWLLCDLALNVEASDARD